MRLSPLDLQWVLNAEFLPLAAVTLVAGALGDRFGQKRIFLAGIALYGLGATAVAFAPSFALLIVGRFLQGLDGTLILPNGHSVLGHAFSADKKARAVGIWSAAAAVAGGVARARRDRRSRVLADDLSDAPARSRRRWPSHRVTQGSDQPGSTLVAHLFDSRTRRAGRGADEPFRSEPLGARHPDHRSGRLSRPDRDRTAIRRQRHAAPSLFASQTGVGATERSRSC